jgi:hypothetical protein
MSYGTDIADGSRLTGVHTGRILGDKPANLEVQQSTKGRVGYQHEYREGARPCHPEDAVRSS